MTTTCRPFLSVKLAGRLAGSAAAGSVASTAARIADASSQRPSFPGVTRFAGRDRAERAVVVAIGNSPSAREPTRLVLAGSEDRIGLSLTSLHVVIVPGPRVL